MTSWELGLWQAIISAASGVLGAFVGVAFGARLTREFAATDASRRAGAYAHMLSRDLERMCEALGPTNDEVIIWRMEPPTPVVLPRLQSLILSLAEHEPVVAYRFFELETEIDARRFAEAILVSHIHQVQSAERDLAAIEASSDDVVQKVNARRYSQRQLDEHQPKITPAREDYLQKDGRVRATIDSMRLELQRIAVRGRPQSAVTIS